MMDETELRRRLYSIEQKINVAVFILISAVSIAAALFVFTEVAVKLGILAGAIACAVTGIGLGWWLMMKLLDRPPASPHRALDLDPRQQTRTFAYRVLRGITPKR